MTELEVTDTHPHGDFPCLRCLEAQTLEKVERMERLAVVAQRAASLVAGPCRVDL